jgi:hypothetical protein
MSFLFVIFIFFILFAIWRDFVLDIMMMKKWGVKGKEKKIRVYNVDERMFDIRDKKKKT